MASSRINFSSFLFQTKPDPGTSLENAEELTRLLTSPGDFFQQVGDIVSQFKLPPGPFLQGSGTLLRQEAGQLANAIKPLKVEVFLQDKLIRLGGKINFEIIGATTEKELEEIGAGLACHWPWALKMASEGVRGTIPPVKITITDNYTRKSNGYTEYHPNEINITLKRTDVRMELHEVVGHEFSHVVDFLLYQLIKDLLPQDGATTHDLSGNSFQLSAQALSKRASNNFYRLFQFSGEKNQVAQRGILSDAIGRYWLAKVGTPLVLPPETRQLMPNIDTLAPKQKNQFYYGIGYGTNEAKFFLVENNNPRYNPEALRTTQPDFEKIVLSRDYGNKTIYLNGTFQEPKEFLPTLLHSYVSKQTTAEQREYYRELMILLDLFRISEGDPKKILQACQAFEYWVNQSGIPQFTPPNQ